MPITKIWAFESYDQADKARDALLQTGFPRSDIEFNNRQEEAGPVQGSFMLPPSDTGHDKQEGFFHSLVSDTDEYTESYAKKNVTQRGSLLLTVNARDEAQVRQIDEHMRRFGGADVDERTPD